jgi:hypothetical protein
MGEDMLSLKWKADEGADNYLVMRSVNGAGGLGYFEEVYAGAETAHIDYVGMNSSYAYRLDKLRGGVIFKGKELTYFNRALPLADTVKTERLEEGRYVRLSWNKDEHADSYIIRKSSVDKDDVVQNHAPIEVIQTSYIDKHIESDRIYTYRLDKVKGSVVYEGGGVTLYSMMRPEPFSGVITAQILNGGKSAYLTWKDDPGADGYRVMRAPHDGSLVVFTAREHDEDGFAMQDKTSAIDSTLEDDKSYLYRLDKMRAGVWIIGKELTVFSRTRPFPFAEAPLADGFRWDEKVGLRWGYDEGADTYILERRYDNPAIGGFDPWKEIWEGSDLSYIDTTVNSQTNSRYEYRLSKRRNGDKYTWEQVTTLAVAAGVEQDMYEPNNTRESSTILDNYREGNIYCYGYYDGRVLSDTDWYKVFIPAGKTANITITYGNPTDSGYFQMYVNGQPGKEVVHNTAFSVKNDSNIQQYIAFAIQPAKEQFLVNGMYGGRVISYTITWTSITSD